METIIISTYVDDDLNPRIGVCLKVIHEDWVTPDTIPYLLKQWISGWLQTVEGEQYTERHLGNARPNWGDLDNVLGHILIPGIKRIEALSYRSVLVVEHDEYLIDFS